MLIESSAPTALAGLTYSDKFQVHLAHPKGDLVPARASSYVTVIVTTSFDEDHPLSDK